MPDDSAKGAPIDITKLRERLRKMPNVELQKFGKACARECSSQANINEPPGEDLVIQLEEARQEWKRRMKRPNLR